MNNADMPIAFVEDSDPEFVRQCRPMKGLTKREYFAGLAMQGLLTNPAQLETDIANQSALAVEHADALLTELERTQ